MLVDLTRASRVLGARPLACDAQGRCAMPAGDLNQDGLVDPVDYELMSAAWLSDDAIADLDGNGEVFTPDYELWQSNLGRWVDW